MEHMIERNGMPPLMGFEVVPFSGGWDSTYCLGKAIHRAVQLDRAVIAVFYQYGQPYQQQEEQATMVIAEHLGVVLAQMKMPTIKMEENGIFDNRNAHFLNQLARDGAENIWFGCRNPFALFDKYGDSNRQWARRKEKQLSERFIRDIKIHTPCVGLPKWFIKRYVMKEMGVPEHFIYSTE